MKEFELKVRVKQISMERLLAGYRTLGAAAEACGLCPNYGTVWSCPPGVPEAERYLKPFSGCFLIGVQVSYPEQLRKETASAKEVQAVRDRAYERIKKQLFLTLLELEKQVPGGVCLGAGRCILCSRCERKEGKPCRFPKLRRYSVTAFGLDFARMAEEQLDMKLLWSLEGLPEYDVAVAALCYQ